ncbi:hypothetical protein [Acinetobacter sp. P1(2025)]|uniref:hypothetical protein n=1 Tax=Acinetobacter sp. P1(2025) TaxID=3446120 RepID=UPI003F5319A5
MKNLKVVVEILSPIVMPKFPIHLDALIYYGVGFDFDKLDQVLAKDDASGVYRASAMQFLRIAGETIKETAAVHATRTYWEDFKLPFSHKAGTITVKGGPYRKKMTKRNAISTQYVQFYAVGDAEKIKYVLSSLGFIGKSNQQGFGQIGNIEIEEVENDFSFFDQNAELARILPIEMVETNKSYLKQFVRYKPSYVQSESADCFLPNFKLITVN